MVTINVQRHISRRQRNEEPNSGGEDLILKAKRLVLLRINPQDSDNQSKLGAFLSLLDRVMHRKPCKVLLPTYLWWMLLAVLLKD
jgi:hypothetical protein